MKRSHVLLAVLGAALVVVAFWFLLLAPQRDDLAAVRAEIAAERDTQARLTSTINALREVRAEAPELEAELEAFRAVVPEGAEVPALLRMLVLAADEAGVTLQTVTPGRPSPVGEATEGLSSIPLSIQAVGSYYQVVDFLRRIEDPRITARGVRWSTASLSRADYPELNASFSGEVFAVIPTPPPPPGEAPQAGGDQAGGGTGAGETPDDAPGTDAGSAETPDTGVAPETETLPDEEAP